MRIYLINEMNEFGVLGECCIHVLYICNMEEGDGWGKQGTNVVFVYWRKVVAITTSWPSALVAEGEGEELVSVMAKMPSTVYTYEI